MPSQFEVELEELNRNFLYYCRQVEENIRRSVQSFLKADISRLDEVVKNDDVIDRLEIEIEEHCVRLMVKFQPLATDLRFIIAILKMNNDLERMGDLAVNIMKKVHIFDKEKTNLEKEGLSFFLPEMVEKVLDMVHKSIDSFVKKDPVLAREICKKDDEVDQLKDEMKVLVINKMKDYTGNIKLLTSVLRNSYHLERLADLATNIAEDVIYLVEGDIIRHRQFS